MSVLSRWRGRLGTRLDLLRSARKRHERNPTPESRAVVEKRKAQVAYAERVVARHTDRKPRIIDLGVTVVNKFGPLGEVQRTIGHYTAGPRDTDDAHAVRLFREYHSQHASYGWGGIGYHYGITKAGSIVCLRPIAFKGAHTAGRNTGSVGIVVHGTLAVPWMTTEQRAALKWLYDNAHTSAMPRLYRSPVNLRTVHHGVHKDYNATSCPGSFEADYKGA